MNETALNLKIETQVCRSCGRELPLSEYRPSRLGLLKTCNGCIRQHQIQARLEKKMKKVKGDEVASARNARLSDFTPRELMGELKRRGYEGTLTFTEVKKIDISKL